MEHGGDVYTEGIFKGKSLLDFSSNINPLGLPEGFKNNIKEALEAVERYPDIKYRKLKGYIKEYLNFSKAYFQSELNDIYTDEVKFDENDIVLGNGAAEIIDLVISCFDSICLTAPAFGEYDKSAHKYNCSIKYSSLTKDLEYDYDDIYEKIQHSEALIIGNPNNPNGGVINKQEFKKILDYCEKNGKKIIVDEAFIEFTGKKGISLLEEAESYSCIFIIKALTKFYAMPGIRLGYGITLDKELLKKIESKQNPWNINCFAEIAAKYSLEDRDYIERSLKWIDVERKRMLLELSKIDIIEEVYNTYSNFVLCKLKNIDCNDLYDLCLSKGIVIRKCDNYKGLDKNYVRFAIKDKVCNELLIEVLNSLCFIRR